jgi:2-polyprenyl-3-methyl-5-hydroxy-6-metoxy-1,4-benzoquinol methylase
VYNKVHLIYGTFPAANNTDNPKKKIVRLFRKELEGKSILDVGCGQGAFLRSVAFQLDHKRLVGIDISDSILPKNESSIEFINCDIVDFDLNDKFEVIFSDQVLEHIAPADLPIHLSSLQVVAMIF